MSKEVLLDFINKQLDGDQFKAELSKVNVSCSAERFVAILKNYIKGNPKSADMIEALSNGELARRTLLQEALKCAADGLIPDGREASIQLSNVNVGTKTDKKWEKVFQYMPMVQGIVKTIYNTGLASNVSTGVIHENDKYEYDLGSSPFIKHMPLLSKRGDRVAAFASVQLKGHSHPIIEIMTAEDIAGVASRSKSKDKDGNAFGPWATDTSEMWRKTVLRRLSKRLPRSSEKSQVLDEVLSSFDNDFELGNSEAIQPESETQPQAMPKGLAKVADEGEYQMDEKEII